MNEEIRYASPESQYEDRGVVPADTGEIFWARMSDDYASRLKCGNDGSGGKCLAVKDRLCAEVLELFVEIGVREHAVEVVRRTEIDEFPFIGKYPNRHLRR